MLTAFDGIGQSQINGTIQDVSGKPVPYANVLLRTELDSSLTKGAISNESGDYIFTDIPKGEYFVEVTILGYAKNYSPVFRFLGTEKRVFMATYTYKFGNSKIKGTRERKVGFQEEQQRVTN
ncbi:MAG: carboxypeptidase-like regulatory domain-containing protein [Cyclobacterium sp.]|uniref:carboxypeptidase-like regulatory domain-containing protein n=1 Tax=unclassified Cyclobacterium TaxID=2615055 RepID=UPI0013CF6B8D|nr:carboxypeptidase-like regulatory domain-containing protein [Cyclobacterium sp. SYSU L10401]